MISEAPTGRKSPSSYHRCPDVQKGARFTTGQDTMIHPVLAAATFAARHRVVKVAWGTRPNGKTEVETSASEFAQTVQLNLSRPYESLVLNTRHLQSMSTSKSRMFRMSKAGLKVEVARLEPDDRISGAVALRLETR